MSSGTSTLPGGLRSVWLSRAVLIVIAGISPTQVAGFSVEEALRATDGLSAYTAEVDGIITDVPRESRSREMLITMQDDTAGLILSISKVDNLPQSLVRGSRVHAVGSIVVKNGEYTMTVTHLSVIGHGPPPTPRDILASDLKTGRYARMLVRTSGLVVRQITSPEARTSIFIRDRTGDILIRASIRLFGDPGFFGRLMHARSADVVGILVAAGPGRGGAGVEQNEAHYELRPRDANDFTLVPQPPYVLIATLSALIIMMLAILFLRRRHRRAERRFQQISIFADALAESERRYRNLAYRDVLTGVPNRLAFQEALERVLREAAASNSSAALFLVDIDRFKLVNDVLGHLVGDRFLRIVAERIQSVTGTEGTVARTGGDEFAIVYPDLPDIETAEAKAAAILAAIAAPLVIDGHELLGSASVGVGIFPRDGMDETTLIRHADSAMYSAKHRGRNRAEIFDSALHSIPPERLEMEQHLRRAIALGELSLQYQPQYSLCDRRLVGFEALLRWNHPTLGSIAPSIFIPIAEECGLIGQIGIWVLEQACSQGALWERQGYPVKLSVNISSYELVTSGFINTVREILRRTGCNPDLLELELSESALLKDMQTGIFVIEELRRAGVCVALDDFGTGFSSLKYLRELPISQVKIDKSFIRSISNGVADVAMLQAIVTIAHSRGLTITAEGIEREEELSVLQDLGCETGQGFFLGHPVGLDTAMTILCSTDTPDLVQAL